MSVTDAGGAGDCGRVAEAAGYSTFEIWPHRSLDRRGTRVVLLLVATGAAMIVLRSPAAAFWPLCLGAVLSVGALALAFWCNNRSACFTETIEIGPDLVRVSRNGFRGGEQSCFSTGWVRIELSDDRYVARRLVLTERGRRRSIGEFLSPNERVALAAALRSRLDEVRRDGNARGEAA